MLTQDKPIGPSYTTQTQETSMLPLSPVLWIQIRMDPELLPGSGIIVPDPAKYERADK